LSASLIDGLHVASGHRTVGDEHRLVQAADLELDEFVRPIDGALGEERRLALSRPFARDPFARGNFLDGHARGQFLDQPQVALRELPLRRPRATGLASAIVFAVLVIRRNPSRRKCSIFHIIDIRKILFLFSE
jgi:hypothetical protein